MKLRELDLQVTNRCPRACLHCCCDSGPTEPIGPTTDQLLDLFGQAKTLGVEEVHLTGGEPLLRADLGVLIDELRRLGLSFQVQSTWEGVAKKGLVLQSSEGFLPIISLDGLADTHDHYRGKGDFARALVRIKDLISEGFRVRVTTVVTRTNCSEVEELLALTGALGVNIHVLFNFSPIGRGKNIRKDWLAAEEMLALGRALNTYIAASRYRLPRDIYLQFGYLPGRSEHADCIKCRVDGLDFIFVLADGRTLPCSWYIDTGVDIGNPYDIGLAATYENLLRFRHQMRARAKLACSACEQFAWCGGGCDASSLLVGGSKDPRCLSPSTYFPGCPERKVAMRLNGKAVPVSLV